MLENTPMVIDRYREATVALGYTGDSVINRCRDIAMMALGFLAARALAAMGLGRARAGARAGAPVRHPRQSDAQRLDAAGAERHDPRLAGGLALPRVNADRFCRMTCSAFLRPAARSGFARRAQNCRGD